MATTAAAMDWEDFEHLVRELFEQEFAQSGGEVRVTQASRDGGVAVRRPEGCLGLPRSEV